MDPEFQESGWMFDFFPQKCGSVGQVGVTPKLGAKPKMAIVHKPCYIEASCRLSYEALVEAINTCLPYHQTKERLPVSQGRRKRFSGMLYTICLSMKS